MKKTKKTALTAAMFSAAIGMSSISSAAAEYAPEDETQVPVYGPPEYMGDINTDGRVDSFDLVEARKAIANGTEYIFAGDMNQDGKFNVADLVSINKFILGKSDSAEDSTDPPTEATTETATEPETEPETVITTIPQPVYGPPEYFD